MPVIQDQKHHPQIAGLLFEQSGNVWSQAEWEFGLYIPPLFCGRPAEAERLIREAIPRAARIGHEYPRLVALYCLATVCIARGDLESAERTARETGPAADPLTGSILLLRGQAEEALSLLEKAASRPTTHLSGSPEALRALGMTIAGMEGAADACTAAMRFLPRPGTSRSIGAWSAVLYLTLALCLSGRRDQAGRLLAETEKIAAEWDSNSSGFPVRTAAGIAAACAGNWTRAEEHHRAAIARMDSVPYVTAQPIARYWYADMLAERGGAGDIEAAKKMLQESIARSDAIGLAMYARLARQRLARIA